MDRFDLETQIMDMYNIDADLTSIRDMIQRGELTGLDEVDSLLAAVTHLHISRIDVLFNTFEELVRSGVIS